MTAPNLDALDELLCRADDAFLAARGHAEDGDAEACARALTELWQVAGALLFGTGQAIQSLRSPPPGQGEGVNSLADTLHTG